MAIDSTLPVRRAMLTIMKGNAPLLAIVPAARHYPQTTPANPTWPFTRQGSPSGTPLRATGVDGGEIITSVHGFAKPRTRAGGTKIESAEDHAARLGAAIAAALDGQVIEIPRGRMRIRWTGSQLLKDPLEADAYHTVQNFAIRALTA